MESIDIDFVEKFCQPIADDEVLLDPICRNKDDFMSLMEERNNYGYCGWPKCDKKVTVKEKGAITQPIFCSDLCFHRFENMFAMSRAKRNTPIGKIVEKFTDQKPPKKLVNMDPDAIEGMKVRIGPYHKILDEIELWVGDYPCSGLMKRNEKQEQIFQVVQKALKRLSTSLKENPEVNYYFVNMDVKDLKQFMEQPDDFKDAFGLALYEVMTGTDCGPEIKHMEFPMSVYDDLVNILAYLQPDW